MTAAQFYDANADAYRATKQLPFRISEVQTFLSALGINSMNIKTHKERRCDGKSGDGPGVRRRLLHANNQRQGCVICAGRRRERRNDCACGAYRQHVPSSHYFNDGRSNRVGYLHADVRNLIAQERKVHALLRDYDIDVVDGVDIVCAGYLLCYARSYSDLVDFLRPVYAFLKPGGRFVTVNDNMMDDPGLYALTERYGVVKELPMGVPRSEGDPVLFHLKAPDGPECVVENYWMPKETMERAFAHVGFRDVHFVPAERPHSDPYWDDLMANPPFIVIAAKK